MDGLPQLVWQIPLLLVCTLLAYLRVIGPTMPRDRALRLTRWFFGVGLAIIVLDLVM
jgi:hypothetical protein